MFFEENKLFYKKKFWILNLSISTTVYRGGVKIAAALSFAEQTFDEHNTGNMILSGNVLDFSPGS